MVPRPYIPAADLAPAVPANATPEDCIRMWLDLMNACDQFLLAGLRQEIGLEGDLQAAYRRWYAEQMEEHDRARRFRKNRCRGQGGR